ncbi:helix-turn-helix domain-containing protein [Amorphus orientalis]|uniref:AraC-like DNA-binding protein n=1 Tax=Amorphus orientalis TaxID=649198 RepID=A0AAE3VRX9_9HYPH|nr:helix-turn-helix domain-containing protein [Amorphus orientalis]MDQ0317269.1 AraC-like DNA-binding protein [Amorphus orientalis]
MHELWSTQSVDRGERLSYWIEAVCDTYVQLECEAPDRNAPFHGRIEGVALGGLGLSRVTSTPQMVRRTPAKIAQATEDYFLVSVQAAGRGAVIQDGRTAELGPGDFALYDSTRPYELAFENDFQQYVLTLPGSVLRSRLRDTETLTARRVCGTRGAGHLMINMIRTLADDVGELEPGSVAAVAESLETILVAGLGSLTGASEPPVSGTTAFHRDQIKAYVAERLRDPSLSIDAIATDLRISPSTVYRAFASEPSSLNGWIWAKRLEGVRRDLGDPALAGQSISTIAYSWGFNDAAHFSRAFKARFGRSAREVRGELGVRRPVRS